MNSIKEEYRRYISNLAFEYGWQAASLYDGTYPKGTMVYQFELLRLSFFRLYLTMLTSFLK